MKEENVTAQSAAADLPTQVQADQCLLEAEKALQNNDTQTAKTAFKKIKDINIEELLPDRFFLYGKFLMENCNVVNLAKAAENGQVQNFLNDLPEARSFLKQFLTQVERIAANYKPALELLSACESTIKAVTTAAKEFEELQKIKNKKAGETLLIHLAASYSELGNTIIGAEEYASSSRMQMAADYSEIVSALLNAVTDVHAKNDNGNTPLHSDSYHGRIEVVKALLAASANVHAKNYSDRTPLQVAALLSNIKVEEALLASSANVHVKNKYGEMPLHDTVEEGQVEVVKVLIAASADTEAMNKYGETPLDLAGKRGKTEVVEILRDVVKKTKPEDDAPFQVKKSKRKRREFFAILGRIVARVRARFLKSSRRLF